MKMSPKLQSKPIYNTSKQTGEHSKNRTCSGIHLNTLKTNWAKGNTTHNIFASHKQSPQIFKAKVLINGDSPRDSEYNKDNSKQMSPKFMMKFF